MIQKSDKYIGAVECGRVKPPFSVLRDIVCALDMDGNELFYEKSNRERSKVADIYLRKMDDTTQKLAIEILQTMANSEYNKKPSKQK